MRPLFSRSSALLFVLIGVLPVAASANCEIATTELPVTMTGLRPLVEARINDTPVKFIVDSGAFFSSIAPAAADRLQLVRRMGPWGLRVEGIGGRTEVDIARVKKFGLGETDIPNIEFLVGGNEVGSNAVGLLGQNILGLADVEYDLPEGAVRIVRPGKDCRDANLAYWPADKPVVEVGLDHPRNSRQSVTTVEINGEKVRAMFDTGAQVSMLSLDAAKRAGIAPGGPGVVAAGSVHGVGGHEVPTWIAPVTSFAIGGERISNTHLRIGEMGTGGVEMLLGADYLLSHRVYVANSQNKIYLSYVGGPAFDLTVRRPPPVAATAAASAASGTDPAEEAAPAGAAAYARRGAARAARRDFALALTDLDRACELAPDTAANFRLRASVQQALGHPALAMSDLDTALRLDPADVDARLSRAGLRIAVRDGAAALADLAEVDSALASQDDLRRSLGTLYERLGRPDLAVGQYDRWVAAHTDEVTLPTVLQRRCWVRALLGTQLDLALADCNAAIRSRADVPLYLESRGLVHFRRDEFDAALADYDAALRIAPKRAWALYGRGLVHSRQGAADLGQADILAARALLPGIEGTALHHGIGPGTAASQARP